MMSLSLELVLVLNVILQLVVLRLKARREVILMEFLLNQPLQGPCGPLQCRSSLEHLKDELLLLPELSLKMVPHLPEGGLEVFSSEMK